MRKFKHVKTGRVAKKAQLYNTYYIIEDDLHIPDDIIENSQDWEELTICAHCGRDILISEKKDCVCLEKKYPVGTVVEDILPGYTKGVKYTKINEEEWSGVAGWSIERFEKEIGTRFIIVQPTSKEEKKVYIRTESGKDIYGRDELWWLNERGLYGKYVWEEDGSFQTISETDKTVFKWFGSEWELEAYLKNYMTFSFMDVTAVLHGTVSQGIAKDRFQRELYTLGVKNIRDKATKIWDCTKKEKDIS